MKVTKEYLKKLINESLDEVGRAENPLKKPKFLLVLTSINDNAEMTTRARTKLFDTAEAARKYAQRIKDEYKVVSLYQCTFMQDLNVQ